MNFSRGGESHPAEDVGVCGSCLVSGLTQAFQEGVLWSSWELRDQGSPELPFMPFGAAIKYFLLESGSFVSRVEEAVGEAWSGL